MELILKIAAALGALTIIGIVIRYILNRREATQLDNILSKEVIRLDQKRAQQEKKSEEAVDAYFKKQEEYRRNFNKFNPDDDTNGAS